MKGEWSKKAKLCFACFSLQFFIILSRSVHNNLICFSYEAAGMPDQMKKAGLKMITNPGHNVTGSIRNFSSSEEKPWAAAAAAANN